MVRFVCKDGPLDGQEFESRYPKGFVVVNKAESEVVIYDGPEAGGPAGTWVARNPAPLVWSPSEPRNIRRAMTGTTYDVVTYDDERMGLWPR